MSWFRKHEEPNQKKWSNRVERKRLEFSASVEESLADPTLQVEEWLDELDDDGAVAHANGSSVIPPRLSLQSRQLPTLRSALPGIVEGTAPPAVAKKEPASTIERLLSSAESAPSQRSSRRLSRTTKVHLQVVPKPQIATMPRQEPVILSEPTTGLNLTAIRSSARDQETTSSASAETLLGNGVFESGQSEVSVTNAGVTEQSVVVVMLAGDPGPVVVQYVSLQSRYGFTVHLSAPTANVTSFNYAILNNP
ncbi:MAG TPA: hypothetical protein VNE61_04920 [Ktedonobacteraceae bacterium]|nr:hypothetical protein [Ktedonobacteraceae bacterium]